MTHHPARQPWPSRAEPSIAALVAVYRNVLPWLVATWALSLVLPGPPGQQVLLNLGASTFYGAATARALGLHSRWNVAPLAIDRAFTHLTAFLVLLVLSALAAAVGATLGAMAASITGVTDDRILSIPLAALATLPILWWHWPASLLAYLVPERAGRTDAGRAWRGPRYADARRLTRFAGKPRRTALLLGFFYLWVIVLVLAGDEPSQPALSFTVRAASYLVVMPVLLGWAATEILAMARRAGARPTDDS
jgi:hypothetical protein